MTDTPSRTKVKTYNRHLKVLTEFFAENDGLLPEYLAARLIEEGPYKPLYSSLRYCTTSRSKTLRKKREPLELTIGTHPEDRWVPAPSGRLDPEDPRHGHPSTYTNHGCRGPKCTKARSEYDKARRAKLKAQPTEAEYDQAWEEISTEVWINGDAPAVLVPDVEDGRHGTVEMYNDGCRCDRCKAAARELVILVTTRSR